MSRKLSPRTICLCVLVAITVAGVLGHLRQGSTVHQPDSGRLGLRRMLLVHRRPHLKSAATRLNGVTQGAVTGASSRRSPGAASTNKQLAAAAAEPQSNNTQGRTGRQGSNAMKLSYACERCVTLVLPTHFGDLSRALVTLSSLTVNFPAAYVREIILVVPYEETRVLNSLLQTGLVNTPSNSGSCSTSDGTCGSSSSGDNNSGNMGADSNSTGSASEAVGASRHLTGSSSLRLPVRVLSEEDVLQVPLEWIHTNTDRVSPRRQAKYRLQMALKLWIAQHITTDWYLTLDSDIVMNRPLEDIMWLLPGGKARYHQVPRAAHATWWRATSELLKNNTCLGPDYDKPHAGFGVTPALLSRNISLEVVKTMDSLYGNSTLQVMFDLKRPMWTEYSLYRTVGCMAGTFSQYHTTLNTVDGNLMPFLYAGMWGKGKLGDIPTGCGAKHKPMFCVVQSTAHTQLRSVVRMFPAVWDIHETQGGVHSKTAEPLDPSDPASMRLQHRAYFSSDADGNVTQAAPAARQRQPSSS